MVEVTHGRFTAAGVGERVPIQTFGRGRVCAEDECQTHLSTYNPRSVCWQHDPGRPALTATRGRRRQHRTDERTILGFREVETLTGRRD